MPARADARPTERRLARRVHRAARRHLRALAVDRRRRPRARGRSRAWRRSSVHWSRSCAAAGARSSSRWCAPTPSWPARRWSQEPDRGVDERAGPRRPDRLHAGGVRADPAAQRRLQREVRLPVHPRGARPARRRPDRAADHRDLRAPPREPPGLRARRVPAQHPPHRRDPPRRQVRRDAGARQPGLGLGRAARRAHRPRLSPSRAS